MKYSKKEIVKFAKLCAKVNTELWNVICDSEDLLSLPIAATILKGYDNDSEKANLMQAVYNEFIKVAKDEIAIDADIHGATLSDVSKLMFLITGEGE